MAPIVTTGWTPSPNRRGTLDILFENFLTLFVCVWTVLHLNLQASHEGCRSVFLRKCRWATLAVISPEMVTFFAIMQWNAANISVKEMESLGVEPWTMVHAFYANAGGFVLETPGFPRFPINAASIHYLCSKGRINLPDITKENIWDRSKADLLAKGFAFVQCGWIVLQISARAAQNITITPLELFTAAFIVPSVATVYFWANKPQNVAEPTVITVRWTISDLLLSAGDAASEPYTDTPMDFVEKPSRDGWKRLPSLVHFGGLKRRPLERMPNDYLASPMLGTQFATVWVVSILHAMVQVLGWWFPFPTTIEFIIWRVSTVTPLVILVPTAVVNGIETQPWFDFSFSMWWISVRDAKRKTFVRMHLIRLFVHATYIFYLVSRVLILVEVFVTFRTMPEDVYVRPEWTRFWPHVGA